MSTMLLSRAITLGPSMSIRTKLGFTFKVTLL